jgi:protein-export membrane protein SecD
MLKTRIMALGILLAGLWVGYFVYSSEFMPDSVFSRFPFKLGLDLAGGTQLIYRADVSGIAPNEVKDAMLSLRDVVERRTNLFGVSEPVVQVERSSAVSDKREERLIVELPGVTDVDEAISLIGKTPLLEFKLVKEGVGGRSEEELKSMPPDELFVDTGLTGRFLKHAQLEFSGGNQTKFRNEPTVNIVFDNDGAKLFADITRENTGKILAIFLDGVPISMPVIREEIADGRAVISGGFTPKEARELARNLNFGALPVPIELISTQAVGASLGAAAVRAGIKAGMVGLLAVVLFLVFWYRLSGLLAAFSLAIYVVVMLALFKLIPVTLTAAGVAGFILSIGMAVDANILIFERIKEEKREQKEAREAIVEGFKRAWLSIRDANISSIITAVILFWFGTSLVQGFALTFGLGVLVSMLTAITISRTFLLAVVSQDKH